MLRSFMNLCNGKKKLKELAIYTLACASTDFVFVSFISRACAGERYEYISDHHSCEHNLTNTSNSCSCEIKPSSTSVGILGTHNVISSQVT